MTTASEAVKKWRRLRHWLQIGAFAGGGIWLFMLLSHRNGTGFYAFGLALSYILALSVPTMLTRTVPLRTVYGMLMAGAFMMCVALCVTRALDAIGLHPGDFLRCLLVPLIEELLKIAPVCGLMWFSRRAGANWFGISDIVLLAAMCGTGFGLVEDAYLLERDIGQHIFTATLYTHDSPVHACAGHALWTSLAGLTLALASLVWFKKRWAVYLGISGFAWAVFDHFVNNFNVNHFSQALHVLYGGGFITLWLICIGSVCGYLFDLATISKFSLITLSGKNSASSLLLNAGPNLVKLRAAWDYALWIRRLAYLDFRCKHADESFKKQNEPLRARIMAVISLAGGALAGSEPADSAPADSGNVKPTEPPSGT